MYNVLYNNQIYFIILTKIYTIIYIYIYIYNIYIYIYIVVCNLASYGVTLHVIDLFSL